MTANIIRTRAARIRLKGLRSTNLAFMRRVRNIAERFEAWASDVEKSEQR